MAVQRRRARASKAIIIDLALNPTRRVAATATKVDVVTAAFQDYSTNYVNVAPVQPAHWIAAQTFGLSRQSREAVLDLVGQLHAIGLTIGDLGWQVSPAQADAPQREATIKALTELWEETEAAANAIHRAVAKIATGANPADEPERAKRRVLGGF